MSRTIRATVVQISDLHLNRKSNPALLEALTRILAKISPEVLIVSGDVANQPVPWQMNKAANYIFKEVCASWKPKYLLVIPGNHDYKFWGNVGLRRLSRIPFEIYFRRSGLEKKFCERLSDYLKLSCNALFWRGSSMRETTTLELLVDQPHLGLAIFAINSNTLTEMMAAGKVESHDLQDLFRLADDGTANSNLAFRYKIAVVHHHPAPIANAPFGAIARIQDSFMIFYNAGLFLHELSRRGFNVVLHGHRHVAGFLRVGCDFQDLGRTVLPVVAAGSATHPRPDDTRGNEINIIEIYDDDTARLEQRFYSADSDRKDESRFLDLNTLEDVRLRRNSIFLTRQQHSVSQIRKAVAITKAGYSKVAVNYREVRVTAPEGLRIVPFSFVTSRPCYLRSVRPTGLSAFRTIHFSSQSLYAASGNMDLGRSWLPDGGRFDYGYEYRLMNAHVLSPEEFARPYGGTDQDSEWASISTDVACELATLSVQFPEDYNLGELEFQALAEYVPAPLQGPEDKRLDLGKTKRHDQETDRVSSYLRREGNGFELNCLKPIPGMIYKIVWTFKRRDPNLRRNLAVEAEISRAQKMLIEASAALTPDPGETQTTHLQSILADLLSDINLEIPGKSEDFDISVMVFEESSRRLKVVYSSLGGMPTAEFFSGEGCAGIAFEKVRPVLYHPSLDAVGYFIHQNEWPTDSGLQEATVLLSVPWLRISDQDESIYVLGVINISSTLATTKLLSLFDGDRESKVKKIHNLVNLTAVRYVDGVR
jgi:hypothetical protein